MQRLLLLASMLVFIAGFQLFILSDYTQDFFAWTINPPVLTAAFLGAAYWSSCVLEWQASRERVWANARIAVPTALTFTALTFVVTLMHFDPPFRLHLNSPNPITVGATLAWLAVYALVPILLTAILVIQLRMRGGDPVRDAPLPMWFRVVIGAQGLVMFGLGIGLFITPELAPMLWAWKLTVLTARAIAAWLIGLGLAALQVSYENDWRRVYPASVAYPMLAVLQLIALARYPNDVNWNAPQAWLYLAFVVSMLAVGVYGWRMAQKVHAA
jgi:hypothetical protein